VVGERLVRPGRVVTRVGAVDCGTNSIRLLVADVEPGAGELTDVVRRMEIVRLGYGVDRTGAIDPAAMERTLARCREYAGQCSELGAERVRFVATSASRDASNAAEFVAGVRDAFAAYDVAPEVVTGDEEASLSFRGATGGLRAHHIPGPYLVVDLGGGSTEFVRGEVDVEAARSVDIGCVRMTERHLVSDPPTEAEAAAAVRDIDAAIDLAAEVVDFSGVASLVGLAGSVTTITANALRLREYDAARIHLTTLTPQEVLASCQELLHLTRAERAALGFMHPGRVDVIGAGAREITDVVSCPGTDSCKLGITSSMGLNRAIKERVDSMQISDELTKRIHIKMSGCPNGCSQHHIANIGFYGASLKVNGRQMPAYIPHIGGNFEGGEVVFGKRLKSRLPAKRVPEAVERWVRLYEAQRNEGEEFNAFVERAGAELFEAEVKDLTLPAEFSLETMQQFIDWNRSSPYEVVRGEGECAI
jgi:exopolyphosphatase/guanosine-5'-triphosphate,3'-diphosphate pyrophosphatase